MKVKELIDLLKQFPEDMVVVAEYNDVEYGDTIANSIDVLKAYLYCFNGSYSNSDTYQFQAGKKVKLPSTLEETIVLFVN